MEKLIESVFPGTKESLLSRRNRRDEEKKFFDLKILHLKMRPLLVAKFAKFSVLLKKSQSKLAKVTIEKID